MGCRVMFKTIKRYFVLAACAGILQVMSAGCEKSSADREAGVPVNRTPHINPDYAQVVLPPNIAPLNFRVQEPLERATLEITSTIGDRIEISSNGSDCSPRISVSR